MCVWISTNTLVRGPRAAINVGSTSHARSRLHPERSACAAHASTHARAPARSIANSSAGVQMGTLTEPYDYSTEYSI